ncbi:hypothetical protein PBY51_013554 [Eleginops maclovinus]|uniref:Uncharacterized protein n=1 Tax=Eleginops maclovinus TaxID=56733 RepID=A0AAN7XZC0_ELEMC|nr:hypothetical protein PBY51_013554 [Eleginops maclovinus]
MSVVPGGAQCYPGLSVMREWSCLLLVALLSPQLPLAQSSALELERQWRQLPQIYHSSQSSMSESRGSHSQSRGPPMG